MAADSGPLRNHDDSEALGGRLGDAFGTSRCSQEKDIINVQSDQGGMPLSPGAQLSGDERRPYKPCVVGSIPSAPTRSWERSPTGRGTGFKIRSVSVRITPLPSVLRSVGAAFSYRHPLCARVRRPSGSPKPRVQGSTPCGRATLWASGQAAKAVGCNPIDTGSSPVSPSIAPIVQRPGQLIVDQQTGVRFPVGAPLFSIRRLSGRTPRCQRGGAGSIPAGCSRCGAGPFDSGLPHTIW